MKRVLITGANSYIGTSVEKWLMKEPGKHYVETIDLKDPNWKEFGFSGFDVVFHVAGIAHVSRKKSLESFYYKVNRDLTIETAQKAKKDGVKQFIFMSSIIVYGNKETFITKETIPNPDNFYGKSKLEAEAGLLKLSSDEFKAVIIRPPMIYGYKSKGNYPKLAKLAIKAPIFPNISNQRSMIYIDNLCELIRLLIENNNEGLFFPQNKEYVSTTELVKFVSQVHNKKIILTKLFNPFVFIILKILGIYNKMFGDLVYDKKMSLYKNKYQIIDFHKSIKISENIYGKIVR